MSTRCRGFEIRPHPYRLHQSRRWTADVEIVRGERKQLVCIDERFATESQARQRCIALARGIIRGTVPGWTIDHLREGRRSLVRPLLLLLALVLAVGYLVLVVAAPEQLEVVNQQLAQLTRQTRRLINGPM